MPVHLIDHSPTLPAREPDTRAIPHPGPTLSEIFTSARDMGGVGFALSQAPRDAPLLWIQDRMSILETGRPYPPGLHHGGFPHDIIHVEARDAKAALWAMEEGLRCSTLGAVIGEIWGNPTALDFTATRRLAVAAEAHGVPATLVLFGAQPNLSGARMRWRVESRPSLPHPWDERAPGAPVWSLDLFRARGVQPGRWEAAYDVERETDRLHILAPVRDRELAADIRLIA